MPAGKIFPASVAYQLPARRSSGPTAELPLTAYRVGIARQATCAAAADPAAAKVLTAGPLCGHAARDLRR